MHSSRIHQLNAASPIPGKIVIYVMSKDQRVKDNLALLAAQNYALDRKLPLIVLFNCFNSLGNRTYQQFKFMISGLKRVEKTLQSLDIGMVATYGDIKPNVIEISRKNDASAIFFDFSPLNNAQEVRYDIAHNIHIPVYEVDSTNIVPIWITSNKEEYSARTIRGKIHQHLPMYLHKNPAVQIHPFPFKTNPIDWNTMLSSLDVTNISNYNHGYVPGEQAANDILKAFIHKKLKHYGKNRNDPALDYLSNLSPYLHFGQLASIQAVLEARNFAKQYPNDDTLQQSAGAFIEEIVVRRELAQNFCYYNKNYDSIDGAKEWAQQTLKQHNKDKREFIYTLEQLENATTHDPAWNAAQIQMVNVGKMHGYMRMYWAKKLLEWSHNAQDAIDIAIYLNDKYELDGYDANGYTGIMWAIAGIHDRAWTERPIFGKIRYMNFNGLKRKFDIDAYIKKYTE